MIVDEEDGEKVDTHATDGRGRNEAMSKGGAHERGSDDDSGEFGEHCTCL